MMTDARSTAATDAGTSPRVSAMALLRDGQILRALVVEEQSVQCQACGFMWSGSDALDKGALHAESTGHPVDADDKARYVLMPLRTGRPS